MHRRLLSVTDRSLKSLMQSGIYLRQARIQNQSIKFIARSYAENPKFDPRFQQTNKTTERKTVDVEEMPQLQDPFSALPNQQTQNVNTADDEREQIRKLRQQIKKREVEDPLGITTVTKKKTILDHVKEGIASLKKSLKDLYKDGQYVYALKKIHGSWKNLPLVEYIKYKNINYDLVKFFPYSFFLIVPLAEFVLPFYILLLPNSTPTQFYSEKTIGERTQRMIIKQKDSFGVIKKKLYIVFGNDFMAIKQKCKVLRENPGDKDAKEKLIVLDAKIQQRLIDEWDTNFSKKLGFYNLSIEEREALLKVFYIEHISGIYMINQLYNLPSLVFNFFSKYLKMEKVIINDERWKLNFSPSRQIKTLAYRVQLIRHMKRIEKEDQLLFRNTQEELNKCSSIELFELIRKRGFKIESDTDSKEFLSNYWTQHAAIKNKDIRVWSIMLRHYYSDYLI